MRAHDGPPSDGPSAYSVLDSTTPDGIPRLLREPGDGLLAGVAAGVAVHIRVSVTWVRVAFAVLALMAGAGVVAYALLWIFVPERAADGRRPRPASPVQRRRAVGVATLAVAVVVLALMLGVASWAGRLVGPLSLVAIGAAFIWREADESRRQRWRQTAADLASAAGFGARENAGAALKDDDSASDSAAGFFAGFVAGRRLSTAARWRIAAGVVLVAGGLAVLFAGHWNFAAARSALLATLLTLVGVAVIVAPWWLGLVRDLGMERRERIRERERADVAAHLHDSVLQTLALIQRQSTDARGVHRLARSQERELRAWLYGPAGYASAESGLVSAADQGGTLVSALATVAGEVEDAYGVVISPVVVGDLDMTSYLSALVAAAREAMVNAGQHAGVTEIDVYCEVTAVDVSVFVRDRGVGFDPAAVDSDRHGIAESIRGRMARYGGTARIRSTPGDGTEVALTVPNGQG